MKLTNIVGAAVIIALCACAGGIQTSSIPGRPESLPGPNVERSAGVNTIPYWESSFSYDGVEYPYQMVGKSPFGSGGSTTIADEIVPLTLVFSDGTKFKSDRFMNGLKNSPLFTTASFGAAGVTQFRDAVMRSEFWQYAQKENYHVLLAPPVIERPVVVDIPAVDGYTTTTSGVTSGFVTFDYFMDVVEPSVIAKLGIEPNTLTIFPTYGTRLLEPGGTIAVTTATIMLYR